MQGPLTPEKVTGLFIANKMLNGDILNGKPPLRTYRVSLFLGMSGAVSCCVRDRACLCQGGDKKDFRVLGSWNLQP
jgi:hypothetical protein